ncbi:MAG TPA: hypothetical protein VGO93_20665, partial [Candidatus Xenobia bacterium]
VPRRKIGSDRLVFTFTEDSMRAYQLLDVFIHELGHHRDFMLNSSGLPGGEPYAVAYARKHGPLLWDRYIDVFGDPTHQAPTGGQGRDVSAVRQPSRR